MLSPVASYEKRSGSVRAVVSTPTGRLSRTFPTMAEAQAWAAPLDVRKSRGAVVVGGKGRTVGEQWPWFIAMRTEPATVAQYTWAWESHLEPAWGHVTLRSLQPQAIKAWLASVVRADELKPASIRRVLSVLSGILQSAVPSHLDLNPARDPDVRKVLPKPKLEYRALTPTERATVLAHEGPYTELFTLLAETGMRYQDAAALRACDVAADLRGVWCHQAMRRNGTVKDGGKNGKARWVPLSSAAQTIVDKLLTERSGRQLLLTSTEGSTLDYPNVRRHWDKRVRAAGLAEPQPTIHDLRHTWASDMADAGMAPQQLRDILGHSSVQTLDRYLHTTAQASEQAYELLEARSGAAAGKRKPSDGRRATGRRRSG